MGERWMGSVTNNLVVHLHPRESKEGLTYLDDAYERCVQHQKLRLLLNLGYE